MSRADTYKELMDACKYDEANKLKKEALDDVREDLWHGMPFGEAIQKVGFEANDEPLNILLDEDVLKGREKKLFAPNIPPFEYIQREDESLDRLLMCEEYYIRAPLSGYINELKQYNVDVFLEKFNRVDGLSKGLDIKSRIFGLVHTICRAINRKSDSPLYLQNIIINSCKALDKMGGRGIVIQILTLYGLMSWLERGSEVEQNEADDLFQWVNKRFNEVCIFYFLTFDHNSDSVPLDNLLASTPIGKAWQENLNLNKDVKHQSETKIQTLSQTAKIDTNKVDNNTEIEQSKQSTKDKYIISEVLKNYEFWSNNNTKIHGRANIFDGINEHEFINMIDKADFSQINKKGTSQRVKYNIFILSQLLGKEWGEEAAKKLHTTIDECRKRTSFAEYDELKSMYTQ
ncbi:hypothetical protein EZS27_023066 [termite gut metagenome]|uniref:Uncharacterized protein n=1 Tax=termite gut metagenome TaxID=433724 RepID=A0A5J4R4N3_9ZZZZ